MEDEEVEIMSLIIFQAKLVWKREFQGNRKRKKEKVLIFYYVKNVV
jgi:hypothetical protein